jgi:hypothetical protein
MSVTVEDLQAEMETTGYGFSGEFEFVRPSTQPRVLRAVVVAANDVSLSRDELGEWVRSKLGRWYVEDSGDFLRHRKSDEMQDAARKSFAQMREAIAGGRW